MNLDNCTQYLQEKQKKLIKEIEKKKGRSSFLKKPQRLGFKKFDKLISAPFKEKLEHTEKLIQDSLEKYKNPCIACSFGKDSTLVLYLVRQYKEDVHVLFNNTGVEYPETLQFRDFLVKEWDLNFHETKPTKTFWQCVEEYGLPNLKWARGVKRKEPKCCYYLKEKPSKIWYKEHNTGAIFTGLSYDESYGRRWLFIWYGDHYTPKGDARSGKITKIHPLAFWSVKEVWKFIKKNNIPVSDIYEELDRCGCMPCTAFIGWEKKLARMNPSLYRHLQRIAGQEVLG